MSTLPNRPTDPDPSSYLKYLISIILYISVFLNYQLQAQQPLGSTIYFSHDNDILKIINGTDRYYSFGLIAGYQKALSHEKVDFLPTQHFKDPRNKYIIGVVAAIKGYTPSSEEDGENSLLERPFAGTFTIRPYLISANRNHLSHWAIILPICSKESKLEQACSMTFLTRFLTSLILVVKMWSET